MHDACSRFIDQLGAIARVGRGAGDVTLKVKYADFEQITRSRSTSEPIGSRLDIERIGIDLLRASFRSKKVSVFSAFHFPHWSPIIGKKTRRCISPFDARPSHPRSLSLTTFLNFKFRRLQSIPRAI